MRDNVINDKSSFDIATLITHNTQGMALEIGGSGLLPPGVITTLVRVKAFIIF